MKFEQKLAQRGSEKKSFGMLTDGQTDDGRKVITIAHLEHSSGELKRLCTAREDLGYKTTSHGMHRQNGFLSKE